jgi:ubiquinone/menaquinone biosynthesis C-methylase UbiE
LGGLREGPSQANAFVTGSAAGVIGGSDVLDVCTGHGVLAKAATEHSAKVSAVDFSEAMVAVARRNVPSMDCHQGDAQDLPYLDGTLMPSFAATASYMYRSRIAL